MIMINYFSGIMEKAPFKRTSRKWHVINCLTALLESQPYRPVTISRLAKKAGISEAALYKHFPGKDAIFIELVNLTEMLVFQHIEEILNCNYPATTRLYKVATLWLMLSEKFPGLSLILSGFALPQGSEPLSIEHARFCERFETMLKRLITELVNEEDTFLTLPKSACSSLIMSILEGKIWQFVRSGFALQPTRYWSDNWKVLIKSLIR